MSRDQLENFLVLLFAFGLSFPIDLCEASVNQTGGELFVPTDQAFVSSESELHAAITDPTKTQIFFKNDIIILSSLQINRPEPILLDFQGFRLVTLGAAIPAIDLLAGELILAGTGSIIANGDAAPAVRLKGAITAENTNYSKLTVGPGVTLFAPNDYAILITAHCGAAYGVNVDFQGKLVAQNGICIHPKVQGSGDNLPFVRVATGANLESDHNQGAAICALGAGRWEVGAAHLGGAHGVRLGAGQVQLEDTEITAVKQDVDKLPDATGKVNLVTPDDQSNFETDPVRQLEHQVQLLRELILHAKMYLDKGYAGNELGDYQTATDKAVGAVRRSIKAAEKLLNSRQAVTSHQIVHADKRIKNAIREVQAVEDELQTELITAITLGREVDPRDYSAYSYYILLDSIEQSETLLRTKTLTINQLYSALCDVNLNFELLDDPEDEDDILTEFAVPKPVLAPVEEETPEIDVPAVMALGAAVILASLESDKALEPAAEPEPVAIPAETVPEPEPDEAEVEALSFAWQNLQSMVEAVQDLMLSDYQAEYAEQFGELQVAIVKANSLLSRTEVSLPEIMDVMDELKFSTAGLELSEPISAPASKAEPQPESSSEPAESSAAETLKEFVQVDWSDLRDVVADIAVLNANDYTTETYQRVLSTLDRAKALLATAESTQSDVDEIVLELNMSLLGLERAVSAPVSQQFITASVPETMTTTSNVLTEVDADAEIQAELSVLPTEHLLDSIKVGVSAYRRSRLETKRRKLERKFAAISKLVQESR